MSEFYPNQKLKSVIGPWIESEGTCTFAKVGDNGCTSITVYMQPGLHSGLPWALVEYSNKPPLHINLLLMEQVEEDKP